MPELLQGWVGAAGGLAVAAMYGLYLFRQEALEKQKRNQPKPPVVNCPDCQGKVSTKAATCPHCGRPMT